VKIFYHEGTKVRRGVGLAFGETTSVEVERVAAAIVDSAIKVHRVLGPGLLESVDLACLAYELRSRGFQVDREVPMPIVYEGVIFDEGFRIDLLVDNLVLIEVKAVQELHPIFAAQCRTYIRLANKRLGVLLNFNVPLLKDGLKRIAN